mmetsp:Transcript_24684/g.69443  ORF Transcript_24684/g.69443 Transcript_24684/m.69443 type:complete len:204 (-) Transcript_24684:1015-1626(-)
MPSSRPSSSTTGTRPTVVTRISSSRARGVSRLTVVTCVRMTPFTLSFCLPAFSALETSLIFRTPRSRPFASTTAVAFSECAFNNRRASAMVASSLSVTTADVMIAAAVGSAGICPKTYSRATSSTFRGAPMALRSFSGTAAAAALAWPPPPNLDITVRRSTVAAPGLALPMRSRPFWCSQAMMSTSAAVSSSNSSTTAAKPGT